ncbi:DUF4168 domain-containing protein [Cyanobacteria bacterium FACHB-471]|nr:DUF4168 domain-containing protein [Cyanobacteria bacterium FACHB-471]
MCSTLWIWLKRIVLVVSAWAWGLLAIAPVSWAAQPNTNQETTPTLEETTPNRSSPDVNDISSEKVSQFVQAYVQVIKLVEQREGELQSAETESESLQVQQEIEAEAFEAIASTGLTWQEYLQLLGLANTDPEFGERIATQLQEAGS